MTRQEPARTEPHDAISQRAAEYFQRKRFWGWSEADQAELDAWLAAAVAHRVAFLRVEGIAARTGELAALRIAKAARDIGNSAAEVKSRFPRRWLAIPLLAAASVALFVALGLPLLQQWTNPPDRVFGTSVGGRALLKFADGTEIELNTNTAVRYRMTTQERTVWLDKGEAFFRVAHNAAHPFAVIAGGHRITDLGTEFLVRDDVGRLDVALVEGRAQLTTGSAETPVAMLVPGDEAVATQASTIVTKKPLQELADELAWRRGVIVFRNTRLADVVREFNRYNETKLVIADPSISGLKFSAAVKTDHYEDFLHLAETVFNLRVDREGNDILISRASREGVKKPAHGKRGD